MWSSKTSDWIMAAYLSHVHKKQLACWTSCKCTILNQHVVSNRIKLKAESVILIKTYPTKNQIGLYTTCGFYLTSLFFHRLLLLRLIPRRSAKEPLGVAGARRFTCRMPFLSLSQWCQSTEGIPDWTLLLYQTFISYRPVAVRLEHWSLIIIIDLYSAYYKKEHRCHSKN